MEARERTEAIVDMMVAMGTMKKTDRERHLRELAQRGQIKSARRGPSRAEAEATLAGIGIPVEYV